MRLILTAAMVAIALPALAADTSALHVRLPPPTLQAEQKVVSLQPKLGPQTRAFVAREVARLSSGPLPDEQAERNAVRAGLNLTSEADIDAVVATIMMTLAQDAARDLREQLADMQAAAKQKAAMREAEQKMRESQRQLRQAQATNAPLATVSARPVIAARAGPQPAGASLDKQFADLNAQKDSLGELGQQQQLRMQMYMDRMAKAMEMLSNIMKKYSETSSSIISNMK